MLRQGTIGHALSLEDGSRVYLDAVVVDKIKAKQDPPYFTIRECFAAADRLVVLTSPSLQLRLGQTIDVEGTISTLENGSRAIVDPTVHGYTDVDGKLLRHGPLIKGILGPTPWQWKVDLTGKTGTDRATGSVPIFPDTTPVQRPSYYPTIADIIAADSAQTPALGAQSYYPGIPEVQGLPDGSLVELECKRITGIGTETIGGIQFKYLDIADDLPAEDWIRAYCTADAATTDRVNRVSGQIRHVDTNAVICVDTGPGYDPQLLEGRLQTAAQGTIAFAKTLPDDSVVSIGGKLVIASRSDLSGGRFYVEEPTRTAGILVHYTGVSAYAARDSIVNISGVMDTLTSGERLIEAGTDGVTDTWNYIALAPLGMSNLAVGGGDFNVLTLGVSTPPGHGLNNTGVLVSAWGRVTGAYQSEKCFYIDDGSGLNDANTHAAIGLKVSWDWQNLVGWNPEIAAPVVGCVVGVTGISGMEAIPGNGRTRVLRPRSQGDISFYPPDTTPPDPGTVASPLCTGSSSITVSYAGVTDDYSGVNHVELYYKLGESGDWTYDASSQSAPTGSFSFTAPGEGTYYFGLQAADNADNWSDYPPTITCSTVYDPAFAEPDTDPTGRILEHIDYLYPGGPAMKSTIFDEDGSRFRQVINHYGNEGELLSVGGDAEPVTYTYNSLYQVTSIADGNSNTTTYTYDDDGDPNTYDFPLGFLKRIQYPGGDTIRFTEYDVAGRVLELIDPNGSVIQYGYDDPEDLPTDIIYPATPGLNAHFDYDPVYGLLTQVRDGSGMRGFAYDNRDVPVAITTTYTGLPARTVGYEFYPDGSLMTMTTPAGDFGYTYDAAGRPVGLTNPSDDDFSWNYLDNDWLLSQASPVAVTSYDHNTRGLLTSLSNKKTDQSLLSQFTAPSDNTGYDAMSNLLSLAANVPNVDQRHSGATTYTYSLRDQLLQEQSTRNQNYDFSFVYDDAGNPTTFEGATRTYNAKNQNTAFTYNANGNPISYNGNTLTYDAENRLTSFGTAMTAGYTCDGLRAWKESSSGRTYYLYSGWAPVCEMNASGTVTAVNTFGANGLLARQSGASDVFYTFDPQGSVSQVLDSTGAIAATQLYDAYGSLLYGTSSYPFGFGAKYGYYTDQETGLQLLTHRYYDPAEGRFLTRDPIGYTGGLNLYGYVANNPVNAADPSGFCGDNDRGFLADLNPFDPNSAWSRQARSIGDFYTGDWKGAAANSGWAMMQESNCSDAEFAAYAGTQVVAGGAALGAAGLGIAGAIGGASGSAGTTLAPLVGSGGTGVVYQWWMNGQTYIGRTTNLVARSADWVRQGVQDIVLIAENLSYAEMRGLEQLMIEINGGVSNPSLANAINGIAARNPNYNTFIDAAWNLFK